METVRIRLLEDFPFPERDPAEILEPAHEGDAGIDLHAAEDAVLLPGERKLVATGIAIALPEGMEAQVRPRSGNALRHGLGILNSPGTIDPGYRGPVKVICHNAAPPFGPEDLEGIEAEVKRTSRAAAEAVKVALNAMLRSAAEAQPGASELPLRAGDSKEAESAAIVTAAVRAALRGLSEALVRRAVRIGRGERIAQLVFARFERPVVRIVESLGETSRGAGGFGSTGTVGERP